MYIGLNNYDGCRKTAFCKTKKLFLHLAIFSKLARYARSSQKVTSTRNVHFPVLQKIAIYDIHHRSRSLRTHRTLLPLNIKQSLYRLSFVRFCIIVDSSVS